MAKTGSGRAINFQCSKDHEAKNRDYGEQLTS